MSENKTPDSSLTSPAGTLAPTQAPSTPQGTNSPAGSGVSPNAGGLQVAFGFHQLLQQQQSPYPPIDVMQFLIANGVSDAPRRIMQRVEQEQDHRHEMDRAAARLPVTRLKFGFAALLLCVGLGAVSLAMGQPWAAVAFVGIPTATIVGIFVAGRLANGASQQAPQSQDSAQQNLPGM